MRDITMTQFLRLYFRQIILFFLVMVNLTIYRDSEFIATFDNLIIIITLAILLCGIAKIPFLLDEWSQRRNRLA
jgi:hypothetical protein